MFNRESGIDGGGLRSELFSYFWSKYTVLMDGALDRVPQVLPRNDSTFFQIGRFISHWYLMTSYIPVCLSIVASKVIICG